MEARDFIVKHLDGVDVSVTVYWRRLPAIGTRGVALGFHAGAFVSGSRKDLPIAEVEYLTENGLVVVSADYRLCPQVSLYHGPIQDAHDTYLWCKQMLPERMKEVDIQIDPARIVVFGQSAGGLLALHLGGRPDRPKAILDFYGTKCLDDDFWRRPLPALQTLPQFDQNFLDQIFDEPVQTSVAFALKAEKDADDRGMPVPDLSNPRIAWLLHATQSGSLIKQIVPDQELAQVEPTTLFSPRYPPTFFLHGDSDGLISVHLSKNADLLLRKHSVESRLEIVPQGDHGFDIGVKPDHEFWPQVKQGLDFLILHSSEQSQ